MTDSLDAQLTKYLADVHSIEEQALQQLRTAPEIAGDDELAEVFSDHRTETEEQEKRVRERLETREASPSKLKDLIARAGGAGMILFAKYNPDTPGKLTAHAFSYEHLELAAYELLALVAEKAGDTETTEVARSIGEQEAAMAARLAENFDRAVEASLQAKDAQGLEQEVVKYLADAHAIENQAIQLLEKGPEIVDEPGLAEAFSHHLEETRAQQEAIRERLEGHATRPSTFKDAAMKVGGLNWGAFFGSQPDTPAKLAGFAFAFEHLEIGGYEQLLRLARRAGDDETVAVVERILGEERQAAETIRSRFPAAVDATLGERELAT